jgi:medium-chain acyl-[acyl-carrier-protein] hydrolase
MNELPFTNLRPMVRAIADGLSTLLDKPFAFFGHSMGALISLELARLLRKENGLEPIHLFVSGHRAPNIPFPAAPTFDLPEAEFIEELRRLNGTPKEVLANPELMQLMLPLLRADFAVSQTYEYSPEPPLSCPITVFGGVTDEVTREQLEPWREQTTSTLTLKMLRGDHFFIHSAEQHILETINQQLLQYARLVY